MPIPLYQVDAFTTEPFRGNPAGMYLLDSLLKTDKTHIPSSIPSTSFNLIPVR
jgi:predicted PhzF superfamily epimerase YddE/YHI9